MPPIVIVTGTLAAGRDAGGHLRRIDLVEARKAGRQARKRRRHRNSANGKRDRVGRRVQRVGRHRLAGRHRRIDRAQPGAVYLDHIARLGSR